MVSCRGNHHKVPKSLTLDDPEMCAPVPIVCWFKFAVKSLRFRLCVEAQLPAATSPWTGSFSLSVSAVGFTASTPYRSRLVIIDKQMTCRGNGRVVSRECEFKADRGEGDRVPGTENMGARGVMGVNSRGRELCQHVPETAATQSCPAGCQACVSCVVSSPVLHHIHCVFRSFSIHRPRRGSPLPAILWLARSRVPLIRRLSWSRIRTSRAHWSGRVVRVTWIRRVTLRWCLDRVSWSIGASV